MDTSAFLILAPPDSLKTTLLLTLEYQILSRNPQGVAWFVTPSLEPNSLLFGRFNSVSKTVLQRIKIKIISNVHDLLSFILAVLNQTATEALLIDDLQFYLPKVRSAQGMALFSLITALAAKTPPKFYCLGTVGAIYNTDPKRSSDSAKISSIMDFAEGLDVRVYQSSSTGTLIRHQNRFEDQFIVSQLRLAQAFRSQKHQ